MKLKHLKVAIVCDWLTGIGGAERVVYEFHKIFPNSPIYTSQVSYDLKDWKGWDWLNETTITTGYLQKIPKSLKKFLPILRSIYFPKIDLSEYDLILTSSGAEAKSIKTKPSTIHVCYCHSPTHYYWSRYDEYLKNPGFPKGLNNIAKLALKLLVKPLRVWDKKAAQQPNYIITNSNYSQMMIKKYYRRDSIVIPPPVDYLRFKISKNNPEERHGLIITGRQTPYKRVDLAIKACNELKVPLLVIGSGPEHDNLVKLASKYITFLTNVTDENLVNYLRSSLGFIFPGVDDFGIAAVEALSAGTPVIAYKKGGALDYITENKNGLFFKQQTTESLVLAINNLLNSHFNYLKISELSEKFSASNFQKNIKEYILSIPEINN